MKKVNLYILLSLTLGMLSFPLEGASNDQSNQSKTTQLSSHPMHQEEEDDDEDEYYDILHRNAIDDTDVLAIPFDDSEVEDEEEIDEDEHSDTFHLPHSK